ncbi:MAG: sigma-70 family RNA polymerase sigma factor [Patescibacteria group bacterium]
MGNHEGLKPLSVKDRKLINYIEKKEGYYRNTSFADDTGGNSALEPLSGREINGVRFGKEIAQYPVDESPEQLLEGKQLAELAKSMIDALPERERKVILLRVYDNKTLEEVGEILDIDVSTVKAAEARAITRLRLPSRAGPLRTFSEENNATAIPETVFVMIEENGNPAKVEVSRGAFESIVMRMFAKGVGTQKNIVKKIAEELECEPLLVKFAINKKLDERARNARSGTEQTQTTDKNPDTMRAAL